MRFIPRALTGLSMMVISVALIGAGVWRVMNAAPESQRASAARASLPEVELVEIEPTQATPRLTLQGRIQSGRETRLSFPISGRLTALSDQLKVGLRVQQGDLIASLDTRSFERSLRTQQLNLSAAKGKLAESQARLEAANTEVAQSQTELRLRNQQLERLTDLQARQLAARNEIEVAELAVNSAAQALSSRKTAQINAAAALAAAELEVERLTLAVEQAEQDLADTRLIAPFDGVLTDVSVRPGDQVTSGQGLAVLTDLSQLEVSFSTQNPRVIRFLQPDAQAPLPLPTRVSLSTGSLRFEQQGRLSRVASNGELATGGRELFATLDPNPQTLLRPGDWVEVEVTEPARNDVTWIPASALSDDDQVFTLVDGRLRAESVEVLERDNGRALINQPSATRIVATLAPRFADGLPVAVANTEPPSIEALIAFVEGNPRMPSDRKDQIVAQLRSDPPPELVERLTRRYQSQAQ